MRRTPSHAVREDVIIIKIASSLMSQVKFLTFSGLGVKTLISIVLSGIRYFLNITVLSYENTFIILLISITSIVCSSFYDTLICVLQPYTGKAYVANLGFKQTRKVLRCLSFQSGLMIMPAIIPQNGLGL
jgi:hypothetical protein